MDDIQAKRLQELLDDPQFIEEIKKDLEDEWARAPKCQCGDRCDPPFDNGQQCLICFSRPTADDMRLIVY